MFSLREITKIRICRSAFFALCVAPICGVLAWSVAVRLPAFTEGHERAIAAATGLNARLGRARTPRPGVVLYESLELSEPETGQLLARLPFVELQAGDETRISLPFPAIVNGLRLDAFWKLAQDAMRCAPASQRVTLAARNLTVHLADGDQSFTDLAGRLEQGNDQKRLTLKFSRAAAGMTPAEPAELTILRSVDAQPPSTHIRFTSATPLPCSLVASLWPAVEHLGKAAEFAGRIDAPEQAGHWKAEVTGRIRGINLDRLVSGQFLHKLSGTAEARIDRLTLVDGRVETALGSLHGGPGVISRSLIQSAEAHLRLEATSAAKAPRHTLAYSRLGVAFRLDSRSLAISGNVPQLPQAILVADRQQLVGLVKPIERHVLDLVRTLVPQSDVQVPATRESEGLTRYLPLPRVIDAPGTEQALPHAWRVRVAAPRQK